MRFPEGLGDIFSILVCRGLRGSVSALTFTEGEMAEGGEKNFAVLVSLCAGEETMVS